MENAKAEIIIEDILLEIVKDIRARRVVIKDSRGRVNN